MMATVTGGLLAWVLASCPGFQEPGHEATWVHDEGSPRIDDFHQHLVILLSAHLPRVLHYSASLFNVIQLDGEIGTTV
jgi:hypothetical protein